MNSTPNQGTLTEGEGSVQLTFSLNLTCFVKKLIMFGITKGADGN
jgi:hypothetical protein